MTQYALGFLFTPDGKQVVLVRKKRPANLAGKLNGIGGQLGPGESPRAGVGREFFEATGVSIPSQDWRPVARLWGKGYEIAGFCAFSDAAARCTSGSILERPSRSEYSVCVWRWVNIAAFVRGSA